MIGISYHGRPLAGVVGLPFPPESLSVPSPSGPDSLSTVPIILFGVVESSSGICGLDGLKQQISANPVAPTGTPEADFVISKSLSSEEFDNKLVLCVSRESSSKSETKEKTFSPNTLLRQAMQGVATTNGKITFGELRHGASGNKLSRLLTSEADVTLLNLKTCRWDTCAPAALLECFGGKLTNLFGQDIVHR